MRSQAVRRAHLPDLEKLGALPDLVPTILVGPRLHGRDPSDRDAYDHSLLLHADPLTRLVTSRPSRTKSWVAIFVSPQKKEHLHVDLVQGRSSPLRREALAVILDRSILPNTKEHDDASDGDHQSDEEL